MTAVDGLIAIGQRDLRGLLVGIAVPGITVPLATFLRRFCLPYTLVGLRVLDLGGLSFALKTPW